MWKPFRWFTKKKMIQKIFLWFIGSTINWLHRVYAFNTKKIGNNNRVEVKRMKLTTRNAHNWHWTCYGFALKRWVKNRDLSESLLIECRSEKKKTSFERSDSASSSGLTYNIMLRGGWIIMMISTDRAMNLII